MTKRESLVLAGLCLGGVAAVAARGGERPVLVVNEDNSHFFGSRTAEQMDLPGLQQFVDQYAGTAVTHLFLCPNAMRANFRSRARDAIWEPVGEKEPTGRWPSNAKLLHEQGIDAYAIWIDRCREQGISPWLSMRMNDVHNADEPDNFMHSTFWRQHPELWRVPNSQTGAWTNRALNYAHAEVREYQMAFVAELLERYDPDGLELDWMRFGHHLTPGREREEGHLLDEFVRRARALTDEWSAKRGHPIRLAVRVPAHPDAAAGLGMDGVAWAREGWVDWLVPCPFWASTDFDIPVELWRERLGEAAGKVLVTPGIEHNSRPWPGGKPVANDLASLAGFAASAWQRGAGGIYLFNWMDCQTRPVSAAEYRTLLEQGLGRETVQTTARRHPVCYRDTVPAGFPNDAVLPMVGGGTCRIHLGPAPQTGSAWVVAGLVAGEELDQAAFAATVNGVPATADTDLPDHAKLGGDSRRALRFIVPPAALADGYNTILIRPRPGSEPYKIVWLELRLEP
ncbi:MAG: hypothetical protein RBU25_13400 [Lentisphaeria bacterium]|jgi:hypothetical protein|nr:hypothetical protein [Lentisphaeria bacterium]